MKRKQKNIAEYNDDEKKKKLPGKTEILCLLLLFDFFLETTIDTSWLVSLSFFLFYHIYDCF
jgi:hypothetical protein